MIKRKLVSAVVTYALFMIIYILLYQSWFIIILGVYIFPIILFYGVPVSVFSDLLTKNIKGKFRGILALFIHLFLATSVVLFPALFSELGRDIILPDLQFFLMIPILASSFFWCIDEAFRIKETKGRFNLKFTKTRVIIVLCILFIAILLNPLKKDLWDVNEELLKKEVLSIEESVDTINLLDVTPFEWDVIYSFDPYTSKDTVYEEVGYKWDNIADTVSDSMNQIVFLNDGKVVCYIYGYPDNNGYGISIIKRKNLEITGSVLNVKDELNFQVTRRNGEIYLSNYELFK